MTAFTASCSHNVAPGLPADIAAGVLDDDHVLDPLRLLEGDVDVGFQRHLPAASQTLVRRDDDLGLGVDNATRQSVRGEAAEHNRMNRADAGASEHRVGRLGNHGQIDGDAVALLDAVALQNVGEMSDMVGKLGIGDVLRFRRIVALPDDRGLFGALGQMAVDAIVRDVGHSVLEPFDRDVMRVE